MNIHRHITVPNMSAGIACIWGLFAMLNGERMFRNNPVLYEPMVSLVAYEQFWGGLWLAAGLVCLVLNYKGKYAAATIIMSTAFLSFAVLYFRGDWTLPAWGLWAFVAVCNFLYGRAWKWANGRP